MAEAISLLEFVELLADSARLRDAFAADPDATLRVFGLHELSPLDVRDAIELIEDNRTVDWSLAYGSGASPDTLASGPGLGDPGLGDPGLGDPGLGDPGLGDPGLGDPGLGGPGLGYPGLGDDAPPAADPDPGAWHTPGADPGEPPHPAEGSPIGPAPDPPTVDDVLFDAPDLHLG